MRITSRYPTRRSVRYSTVGWLLLITLLCVPVVIVQRNWAGLGVAVLALTISVREVMAAIRRGRD